jgi:hypothetical protein
MGGKSSSSGRGCARNEAIDSPSAPGGLRMGRTDLMALFRTVQF